MLLKTIKPAIVIKDICCLLVSYFQIAGTSVKTRNDIKLPKSNLDMKHIIIYYSIYSQY